MKKAYYDSYDYPSYWKGRDYEHESEVIALNKILDLIPKLDSLADMGAGFGRLTPVYLKKANKVFLIEPSKTLLDIAAAKYSSKIENICSSLEDIEKFIPKQSLDALLMVRVMHHLKDPKESIRKVGNVLKKDGYFILEFANKIHGKAVFKSMCAGDFTFPIDVSASDMRCLQNQKEEVIPFYNYHPDVIREALAEGGFKIIKTLSVSNVRSKLMKKHVPFSLLIRFEDTLQGLLSPVCFGPSIFVLAQKRGQNIIWRQKDGQILAFTGFLCYSIRTSICWP